MKKSQGALLDFLRKVHQGGKEKYEHWAVAPYEVVYSTLYKAKGGLKLE